MSAVIQVDCGRSAGLLHRVREIATVLLVSISACGQPTSDSHRFADDILSVIVSEPDTANAVLSESPDRIPHRMALLKAAVQELQIVFRLSSVSFDDAVSPDAMKYMDSVFEILVEDLTIDNYLAVLPGLVERLRSAREVFAEQTKLVSEWVSIVLAIDPTLRVVKLPNRRFDAVARPGDSLLLSTFANEPVRVGMVYDDDGGYSVAVGTPNLDAARSSLEELSMLADNWDGEGAPTPSRSAIDRAREVLQWLENSLLHAFDISVDPDAIGGVAVWICRSDDKRVWVSCWNNGEDGVVLECGGEVEAKPWDEDAKRSVVSFLISGKMI